MGTSFGATMPRRTLSPRISTTVTVMSLLMTILSFFFLDSTNIAAYPSWKAISWCDRFPRDLLSEQCALRGAKHAGEDPLLPSEPDQSLGGSDHVLRLEVH